MPRVRRYLFLSFAVAIVGGLVVGVWLLPRAPDNAAKIEEGMMLADVEAILGGPAQVENAGVDDDGGCVRYWSSETAFVQIVFDGDDRVTEVFRVGRGPLESLRRWLGL
jgi:hypothetical protein